ncbi:bifunctional 3'-5' exonuclease/ATP-dependent helicase WRN isoform X2 [Sardina pilchardus]|uniref:bifunctional 3'-5' exonuclease/ATP-dependent helicase WRN isoform X2 n=1 Tax=Sardina pilchardus TaxID=27697 RepID=UPI002E133925
MTDRTLPGWMANLQNTEKTTEQSGPYKKNVLEPDLPFLEFTGTIIYSQEKNDCSFLSEDLRSCLTPGAAIGFDLEWPPSFTKGKTKKVAMVQLCASEQKCYLFHLSSMSGFPPGLKMLLEDETLKKVGVGIEGDKWKLLSDFDIKLRNFVELSDLANEKLRCMEKWSLNGLVKHLFRMQLFKEKDVRCSQWDEFELTQDQKRYAATDAYAGLIIHQKLESMVQGEWRGHSDLKGKLSQLAKNLSYLTDCVPPEAPCTSRTEELIEEVSQRLETLREEILVNSISAGNVQAKPHDSSRACPILPDERQSSSEDHHSGTDRGPTRDLTCIENCNKINDSKSASRDCIMSLDISEFELQMIEMQARQEELEEQSTLDFKKTSLNTSSDFSCEVESDEELENEMLQCVEEVEKLNNGNTVACHDQKQSQEECLVIEEDDEDIEEEEEEGFDPALPQPTPEQVKCLKMYFGHHSFKPVQWKVIHSVLKERRDNLVVMATGYGKSLCFQYPPVLCGNVSVVISPLIALMEDQVLQLQMSNIPSCYLGSAQKQDVSADLRKGHFRVVYMTPEYCSGNIALLEHLNNTIGLSLVAIDEAHCISQWGHDFRNAYRDLGKLKKALRNVPIVALTATASPSIREDIVKSLHLKDPIVTCTTFDRPNLYLDVNRKSSNILQDFKPLLNKKKGGGYEFEGPAIVYCAAKKLAERVAGELTKLEIRCGVYHAGLQIKQRRETQHRFMRDEIQCIVATVAFGMGINKADIRKVIHYGAPKEMESYYQEIGRAGRDGLPAACHVLWAPQDMGLNRFLLNQTNSDKMRIYKMQMMAKMEKYLNSTRCRRKLILSHFEDKQLRKVTSGILGTNKCCDNCKLGSTRAILSPSKADSDQSMQDFGEGAFQLLGAIDSLGERFGVTVPILFLRGSTAQKVPEKYRRLPLFGAGKTVPEAWWKALGRSLVIEGYLAECSGYNKFTTLCKITPKGRTWYSQAKVASQRTLLLQPNQDLRVRTSAPRQNTETTNIRSQGPTIASESPQRADRFSSTPSSPSVYKEGNASRTLPRLAALVAPKPQPPPVSARDLELQTELYGKLVYERQKLASLRDIPPAILATNKILLDMAKTRPCTVASLKQVDGVSEAKSIMLQPLLHTIVQFCKTHSLQMSIPSTAPSSAPAQTCPPAGSAAPVIMPDSVLTTYRLFQLEGKSLRQVCDLRSLPLSAVECHLLQALSSNQPLDLDRAGLTSHVRSTITRIITSPPVNSDLSDVKAIRARVPEEISTFLVRLTVTLLQRDGLPHGVASSSLASRNEPAWIEPEDKPIQASKPQPSRTAPPPAPKPSLQPPPFRPPAQASTVPPMPALDEMDGSEDDLFSEMPMPEDEDLVSDTTAAHGTSHAGDTPPVAPHTSAMDLTSWNQEELDTDTQELFAESPTQQQSESVSQPAKRKLPEWAEAPRSSLSVATAKKNKRKKGLFM